MNNNLAIIGSGPTAIYCLKHILDHSKKLQKVFNRISIFEKYNEMGYGMPYNPETTDKYNLANISSAEIPELLQTFGDWLRAQDQTTLNDLNVTELPISDSEVYSRLALGHYFKEQFHQLVEKLESAGFTINTLNNHLVNDIHPVSEDHIKIIANKESYSFSKVIIATGHNLNIDDKPEKGYYATPWPIQKLIPKPNEFYNFEIGILGASLSAFDVVTSLAHRHGRFTNTKSGLAFTLHHAAKHFKITLHAAEGWLPHLQYEQVEPFREIYRHTTRHQILGLRDAKGFLSLETFFENICKPALIKAFQKDKNETLVSLLNSPAYHFQDFLNTMEENHEYTDSFKGMRLEMEKAKDSIEHNNPIHWMETLDDLMYCLNFHTELLSAEDHIFFNTEIKPFLMSVIAALPLNSAKILLALYDANVIDLVAGKVEILETKPAKKQTELKIESDKNTVSKKNYKLFINCAGNDNITLENFPFKTLKTKKHISNAVAEFNSVNNLKDLNANCSPDLIFKQKNTLFLKTGGISVDNVYRLINKKGTVHPNIFDLAITHVYGCRPYSYGLQACNATSAIVINALLEEEIPNHNKISISKVTKLYKTDTEL